jgi:hypothetical protein
MLYIIKMDGDYPTKKIIIWDVEDVAAQLS